jgi:spore germination protein YaaH
MAGLISRLAAAAAFGGVIAMTTPGSSIGTAAAAPPVWRDPAQGPHARDEARHLHDQLQFSPARTAIQPRVARPDHVAGPATASAPSGRPLQREVFAFAPYWALAQNAAWNYSLMSTVAYFGLDVNADGSFVQSDNGWYGWTSQDLVNTINQAHQAGDRVVVVIKAFDNATICSITSTSSTSNAAQTAITNTIGQIHAKSIDGVNVDFEGSNTTCPNNQSLQTELTSFMGKLSSQVHQQVPGSFVTIDTYSGSASWDSGEFNIGALAPVVDAMFDMAYDMRSGNTPGQAGPNAPLNGWTYNDTTSVSQFLTKAPASKVILGVPYYGYKFSTSNTQAYATITGNTTAEPYSNVGGDFFCAASDGLQQEWDATASSPWASWISPATGTTQCPAYNSPRELYYDDAQSLGYKYDLVNRANLRGTGMWALGYDGNAPELWQAIQNKFVSWSGWESLGGSLGSAPSVASWASGRLDVFARGNDGSLIHKWYDGSSWHGWESLGGNLTSSPAAVSWTSGRLDIFARGPANDLIHKWYDGTSWSGWESLGGVLADAPSVSSWGAGRLDIFVRGGDNALWHRWYNGGWFGWEGLGGVLTSNPAAASMTTGRLDVFARGGDNALWHRWYDANGWANWESLGGILASGPAASTWGTGRLDVFMRGTDNALWHDVYASNTWSWEYLGGSLTSAPGAVSWGLGRIDAFGRGPDGTLWHKWFQGS